jgi:hypothetical protein
MKKLPLILLLFPFLCSCEEKISNQNYNDPTLRLVIDAMITNHPGESYVRLSLPVADPNEEPQKISGALVEVSDGNKTEVFTEDPFEKGSYRPDPGLRAVNGKIYRIIIQAGDFLDTAYSYLVRVTPLNEFKTSTDNSKPGYFFLSGENSGDPAMIRYIIDPTGCSGEMDCRVEMYEYILNSYDIAQIFSPKKEILSFPSGSRVIRKKYSLNPDYESYIRALLSETEWRGGLFDVEAGTPKGNFSGFSLGYFAGCSLVIDTVYIQ